MKANILIGWSKSRLLDKALIIGVLLLVLQTLTFSVKSIAAEKENFSATQLQFCIHHSVTTGLFAATGEYWPLYDTCR